MNRRQLLATFVLGVFPAMNRFAFRIRTKSGSIVGNVVIEARDVEAAKVKLFRRYPDCQILGVEVK